MSSCYIPITTYFSPHKTDASNYSMGAVIIQQQWPLVYWSCKLVDTQQKYHTMEKQFISIVMVLEEFLSAKFFTYTDHKNLIFANLNCCCILLWQLLVEEYGPTIIYHPFKQMSLQKYFPCSQARFWDFCQFLWRRRYQWWPWHAWVVSQITLT